MHFRHHLSITSTLFKHREKRDDTYVQVKEGVFGQVEDILFIHDKVAAIILLRIFEKEKVLYKNTVEIPFPINQFPVKVTNRFSTAVLTNTSYIQKIVRSDLDFKKTSDNPNDIRPSYPFFSIRPNPWFRF
jgi:hypothetical protein